MNKKFLDEKLFWIREPKKTIIDDEKIEIYTEPNTDLWQRTYYGFQNDNAPVLQTKTKEKYFSFIVKTKFESGYRFDQCGVAIYIDSENWFKASVEYENEDYQRLGSVVTNNGYSDWATQDISASIKEMYYRLSRRESDFLIECSEDGENFKQMRIFHLFKADDEISFGIYACSPENSSFKAVFTGMHITECKWQEHK
ncbi:DUF1349 domain-containing protein [Brachyspira alvinipulli]|uniref:DUF1349 domain-containing protein n=1 Tax=Brachyspira alvinipulli TaxID=84379 RepID=UPI000480AD90|nr:DUF1349 domain-containing protein [Brachyspira alvinipulli]